MKLGKWEWEFDSPSRENGKKFGISGTTLVVAASLSGLKSPIHHAIAFIIQIEKMAETKGKRPLGRPPGSKNKPKKGQIGGRRVGAGRRGGTRELATPQAKMDAAVEARKYSSAAIKTLARNMDSVNPMAQVNAAKALLDRGYGKSAQTIDITAVIEGAQPNLVVLSDAEVGLLVHLMALSSPDIPDIEVRTRRAARLQALDKPTPLLEGPTSATQSQALPGQLEGLLIMLVAESGWLRTGGKAQATTDDWQAHLAERLATLAIELRPPTALITDAIIEPT